jgi:hypothetical protein
MNEHKTEKSIENENIDLLLKRKDMTKESWIKNVMRIYPHKTREETETLWEKLFEYDSKKQNS